MKNSYSLEGKLDAKYQRILDHDKIEIDNPDKHHPTRLNYIDRLNKIISIIRKMYPIPDKVTIGDFACAQGNLGLILAELDYKVFAIDINPTFIEYSKMKYEKGEIDYIVGNIGNICFHENILDVAIAGELIEHCAYPEEIIEKIIKYVKPGGLLIITTPNGSNISRRKQRKQTFSQVFTKEQRSIFTERQFGPDANDHLFYFTMKEIKYIVPKGTKIIEEGYSGTILVDKFPHYFLKFFPVKLVEYVIRKLSMVPVINKKLYNGIYIVLRKIS